MVLNVVFGSLAALSLALLLWQWIVAGGFPLHRRGPVFGARPPVTLLKPLKGCDTETESCLRSWFVQEYDGPVQMLFGVASKDDPVCAVVNRLISECVKLPGQQAELVICGPLMGANAKVSKLAQMETLAKHDILVVSDADVKVAPDFLSNFVAVVEPANRSSQAQGTENENARNACGLVNCFYRLANPSTAAMEWEAIAINADFWSQVLQARSLKPLDFALGAVMGMRREALAKIGGFASLADCLADDYQLGNRIAAKGYRIELATVPVECWSEPMSWGAVWKHQLRWARTIRVSQPLPYFFSILSNSTLWPLLWIAVRPGMNSLDFGLACFVLRMIMAVDLQSRLAQRNDVRILRYAWMAPVKDVLQTAIWALAFLGNRVEWRGEKLRLRRDGTLERQTGIKEPLAKG